jgi:hypothetical protein
VPELGTLKRDVQERLQATEREKIMAQMGISVDTCLNLLKWMDLCDPLRVSELEVIVAAALTAHAKEIHVPLRRSKFRQSKYPNLFQGEVERLSEGDKMLFTRIIGPSHRPPYEQEQALKKALILINGFRQARRDGGGCPGGHCTPAKPTDLSPGSLTEFAPRCAEFCRLID